MKLEEKMVFEVVGVISQKDQNGKETHRGGDNFNAINLFMI